MSKELQEIDYNCNDCKHLVRSIVNRQKHVDSHYDSQKKAFNLKRIGLISKGEERLSKEEKDKAKLLFKEARKLVFVFDEGQCSLSYGRCTQLKKDVSFIANTSTPENFMCFKHRKDLTNTKQQHIN